MPDICMQHKITRFDNRSFIWLLANKGKLTECVQQFLLPLWSRHVTYYYEIKTYYLAEYSDSRKSSMRQCGNNRNGVAAVA